MMRAARAAFFIFGVVNTWSTRNVLVFQLDDSRAGRHLSSAAAIARIRKASRA
jgi:hypothetical protein